MAAQVTITIQTQHHLQVVWGAMRTARGTLVGICDALGLTIEADDEAELCSLIPEAQHFLMVTAVGSDARSGVFYSRVKGEAEEAVARVGIKCVSIFRPSLILGPREESRMKERLAKTVASAPGGQARASSAARRTL